jgi:hypothetical protein
VNPLTRFESGDLAYNTASRPITFDETGALDYFETDIVKSSVISNVLSEGSS